MLIVTDDANNMIALTGIIKNLGLDPIACENGHAAISTFQLKLQSKCCQNKFDLVIADLNMQQMTGTKLAECLRAMELTFLPSMIEKGGVGKLKSRLNNSYIILIAD